MSSQKTMNSTDITKIIKACAEAGVYHFKLDGLEIDFIGVKIPANLTYGAKSPNNDDRGDLNLTRDEQLDHDLLSDPATYEEEVDVTE